MKKIVQGQKRFWSLTLAVLLALSLAIPLGTAWAEESTPAPSAAGPTQAAGEQTPTPSEPAPEPSAPAPAASDEAPAETTEAPTATPTPTPDPAPSEPAPTPTATPAPSLSPETSPTPIPAQWTVQVQAEEANLSAQAEAVGFAVQGDCTGEMEGTATLALTLHAQGRSLPQGTAAYDAQAGAVTVEGKTVLRLFGLPAGASVSVESAAEDALRLRIEIPAASFALHAEAVLPALTGEGEGALTLAAELGGVQAQAQASLAAQEAAAQVLEWAGALTVPLTWADNDDAKGLRPDAAAYPAPSLLVSIDGGEVHAPTAEDETLLGLAALPEVEVAQDLSALAVAAGTLPARTTLDGAEHTMVWSIAPAPVESYALEQTEAGYTYRLVGDVEITTEAYAGALYASASFLDFDNALETRPEGAALQASLLVAIDGGAAHAPAEADLALLGIASLPEVSSAWTAAGVTFSVPGDVLPARVLHTAADGTQTAHTVVWTIQPPEIEGYTLLPGISAMRAGDGASAWVYEIQYEEDMLIDAEKTVYWDEISQAVFWADNKDEARKRPSAPFYTLRVSMTGLEQMEGDEIPETPADGDFSPFAPLTVEDLKELGLNGMPEIAYSAATGIVSIESGVLPETLVYTDVFGDTFVRHVKWELRPEAVPGYELREVTQDQIGVEGGYTSIDEPGWYYVLLTDVEFDIRVNAAAISDPANYEKLTEAIQNYFRLSVLVDGEEVRNETLADLAADAQVTIDGTTPGNNTGSLTISDTWKYNLDGTPIVYTVHSSDGLLSEKLEGVLEAGDRLEVNFDNTNAPNYGSDTSALHPGGELVITLKGETDYNAKKQWLDEGEKEGRPQVTYELWRYREGQGYDTAAPVRDSAGKIIELKEGEGGALSYGTAGSMLDKYDAEGYRYIYVVREYMTSGTVQYEQVFGEVDEDGTISGDVVEGAKRPNGNTYLYDGGILSNRRTGSVQTSATKDWDASAFQAEFEDVTVELTLQSRPAGVTPEAEWKDTGTTAELDDFYAEHLTVTHTDSAPQYDALGRELEYRWVETGVYQGADSTQNLFRPDGNGGGTFTLQQSERIIKYRSTVQVDEASGHTTVTNTIANTIDYDVEKHWDTDGDGEYDTDEDLGSLPENMQITFALYRTISGQTLPEKAYVSFPMDGTADATPTELKTGEANVTVTVQETAPWVAKLTGLPEFDDQGRAYEYVLLESGAADYFPTYETTRDGEGNYRTDVYNAPGDGNRILVRKEWIDDSDIAHREPVTIQVYERATNKPVGNPVVLGEDGVWQQLVGIRDLETEDVYILETKVGGKDIPLQSYTLGSEEEPSDEPQAPEDRTAIQFAGAYHNYEATYSDKKIENEHCYIVTNRRLGRIDLTVTKEWIDGDRQATEALQAALEKNGMALALRLEFDCEVKEGYVIGTDSVTLGGQDVNIEGQEEGSSAQSVQILLPEDGDLTESNKKQTLYFFNLPKYDKEGTSVTYTVEEIVVYTDSLTEVPAEGIPAELYQYSRTVGETTYVVGDNHAQDKAYIDVTNRLQETKTVNWHKEWYDEYAYAGNLRPDIYLNIYKVEHDENGDPKTPEIYVRDYRWVYKAGTGTDQKSNWTAQISGLPRYDDYGYEILYYATEHTVIDWAAIDYVEVEYKFDGDSIGSASDPVDETTHVVDVSNLENTRAGERLYALQEGGTFINRLENNVTIQGQKVWSSLPAGWNPANLPTVTFAVDQYKGEELVQSDIAKLTVSDWTDWQNGTYTFQITHTGENTPGETEVPEGEQPLPKYDEKGNLYNYVLREVEMTWDENVEDSAAEKWDSVFKPTIQPGTYLATNTYAPDTGSLSFQKYLELPMGQKGPLSYPAVKFEITRTYTDNEGQTSAPEVVERVTWTSDEVEEAYTTSTGARSTPVQKVFTVEDLELYAPNGSPYVYTVTEVKDGFLEGYDTWAAAGAVGPDDIKGQEGAKGTVKISGLKPTLVKDGAESQEIPISATFLNARQKQKTVELTFSKKWLDYGNALNTRPDELTVKLTRKANSQPGQNNPVPEDTLSTDTYTITWTKEENSDTWVYSIQGKGGTELEKYAPNGMPWIYIVKEEVPGNYTGNPSSVQKSADSAADDDGKVNLGQLVNSIQTDVLFSKNWAQQGEDGEAEPITEDYLGFKIAVTFELQVREKGAHDPWEDADAYGPFQSYIQDTQDGVFDGEYAFEKTLTGFINEKKSGSFKDLPLVIPGTGSSVISLEYRVVETQVKYGEKPYEVEIDADGDAYTVDMGAPFTPPDAIPGGNNAHTNRLKTQDLTVTKIWERDHGNAYGSRPDTDRTGYDWQVSFLIQQSSDDGATWTRVQAHDGGAAEDLVVTLYGKNDQDTVSTTISGLPRVDQNGKQISYRAREMQPNTTTVVSGEGKDTTFYNTYTVKYKDENSHTTATNTLKPTKVLALKEWNPGETDGEYPSVGMTLEYQVGKDAWEPLCTVTVNGEADETPAKPYYEYDKWHAVWKDLPVALPDSMLIDGKTHYRVVETVPDGYVQESAEKPSAENENTYTFTNVEAVDFTVTKYWHVEEQSEIQTVKVQLYRTTNAQEKNPDEDEKVATVDLTGNSSHTFRNLPKYAPDGELYTYYARETPEWGDGYDVYYSDEVGGTTIRNVGTTSIAVTKIWKDNGNAYNTRPEDLDLTLQRKIAAEDNWTPVEDVQQPEWTKNKDTWTCTYTGLPYADANGNRYTYRVTETGLDREDMLPANAAAGPAHADSKYAPSYAPADGTAQDGKVQITNTLQEYIEIPVTKVWVDGGPDAGERPASITFVLCAGGVEVNRHTVPYTLASRIADLLTGGEGEWEYTFKTNAAGKRLPRYDAEGRKILYTVREEPVPDGYKGGQGEANDPDDASQGFTVRNEKVTQLTVTKVWHEVPAEKKLEVVVRLYRYTNDLNALEPGTSAALNAGNNWTYTFADLPQYEAETDAKYIYVAREVSVGGTLVEHLNYEITHTDGEQRDGTFHTVYTTTIANVGRTDIPVTKTWLDNGNAYGTRPDTLTLTLYRRIEGGAEVVVREVTPPAESWTKDEETDTWTYTFADLPIADKDGNWYIYRVAETVPEGYIRSDNPQGDLTLTNTLYAQIDIPVTKTWVDNSDGWGKRPESVTIALYRQSDLTARELVHTLTLKADGGFLEQVRNALTGRTDDDWTYTFTDLPRYDKYGALYTYTIEETLPSGYEDRYDVAYDQGNFTVTNTRAGDLRVEKEVTGSDGQRNRDFTFTVTLDDATIQGTYGGMTFENGVATFTLRHGQSATAEDLPAGIGYTVVEREANTNRYRTTYTGETGTIPAGDTAVAHVENRRNRQTYPDYTEEPTPTPEIPEEDWHWPDNPPHDGDWHDVPRTGDTMHLTPYLLLAALSAAGLAVLAAFALRRRRRR